MSIYKLPSSGLFRKKFSKILRHLFITSDFLSQPQILQILAENVQLFFKPKPPKGRRTLSRTFVEKLLPSAVFLSKISISHALKISKNSLSEILMPPSSRLSTEFSNSLSNGSSQLMALS